MASVHLPLACTPPPLGFIITSQACHAFTSGWSMPQVVNHVFGSNITSNEFLPGATANLLAAISAGANAPNIFGPVLGVTNPSALSALVTAVVGDIGSVPRGAATSFTPSRIRDFLSFYAAQASPTAAGVSGLAASLAAANTICNTAIRVIFVALFALIRSGSAGPGPLGRLFARSAPLQGAAVAGESNAAYVIRDFLNVYPHLLLAAVPAAGPGLPPLPAVAPVLPAVAPVLPAVAPVLPLAPLALAAPAGGPPPVPPGLVPPAAVVAAVPPVVAAHPAAAAIAAATFRQAAAAPVPTKSAIGTWTSPAVAQNMQHWTLQYNQGDKPSSSVAYSIIYQAVARAKTASTALAELKKIESIISLFSPIGEGGDQELLGLRADCHDQFVFGKQDFHLFLRLLSSYVPGSKALCDSARDKIKSSMEDAKLNRAMLTGQSLAQVEFFDSLGMQSPQQFSHFAPRQQPFARPYLGHNGQATPLNQPAWIQPTAQQQPAWNQPAAQQHFAMPPPSGFPQPPPGVPPAPNFPHPHPPAGDQIGTKRRRQPNDGIRILTDMCMSAHPGVDQDRARRAVLRYLRGQCSACLQVRIQSGRFSKCPTNGCTGFPLHPSLVNAGKLMAP